MLRRNVVNRYIDYAFYFQCKVWNNEKLQLLHYPLQILAVSPNYNTCKHQQNMAASTILSPLMWSGHKLLQLAISQIKFSSNLIG